MKKLLLITLIFLFSCDQETEITRNYQLITGQYQPYVNKFNTVFSANVDNLIIREVSHPFPVAFDSIRSAVPDNSYTDPTGQNYIELDTAFLNKFPRYHEQIIFKHLGHLYFERDNEWEFISLMYWSAISVQGYANDGVNYFRWELLRNAPDHIRKKYTYTGPYDGCRILRGDGSLPCNGGNPHSCDEPSRLVCD